MNLYYINLGLDYNTYFELDNHLRYDFQQRVNFINDYFSKAIRKLKFKTDGTFNMISIACTEFELSTTSIVHNDVLKVSVPINIEKYNGLKYSDDCSYYLELLEEGFKKASDFKEVPIGTLLNIVKEFKQGGCKNEWLHKRKRFKEDDLEVILMCEFTISRFQLVVTINKISTKENLVNGALISTEVGVSIHEGMYKDIVISNDIVITDKTDSPRIIIDKELVFNKKLVFKIIGGKELQKILSFSPHTHH